MLLEKGRKAGRLGLLIGGMPKKLVTGEKFPFEKQSGTPCFTSVSPTLG